MKKRNKIALIANTSNFFNSFFLQHIHLLSKNYELLICCNNANKLKKYVPKNIKLINISYKRGVNFLSDLNSLFCTLYFFLKNRPDISISFTPKIGFMTSLSSLVAGTPNRIHWFTGQIWTSKKGFLRKFYKLIDKLIFFISRYVLIDSHSQEKFLINEKVILKKKSFVLHKGSVGGVDTKKFKYNKKKRLNLRNKYSISMKTFTFLFLGRINKDKGIVELIKAFETIDKKYDVKLIFVGPIEDKELINLLKKNKRILHHAFTTKPEDWFSMADILCLPSHREGFGTVVIEAASCGIPSLCSKIYGLSDAIIENKTGFFHKAYDVDDIKDQMLYVINNKKLVKRYGNSAKIRVVKDFNNKLLAKKLLKFIKLKIR